MNDSRTYLRYVVVEVTGPMMHATVHWEGRARTAAEGYQLLESRIADSVLTGDPYPRVALIDCNEGRILGFSGKTPPGDGLVMSAVTHARSFVPKDDADDRPRHKGMWETIREEAQRNPKEYRDEPLEIPGAAPDFDPADAPEDEESSDDDSEDMGIQPFIDAFVAEFLAGREAEELYKTLCDNLEASEDALGFDDEPIAAIRRDVLVRALQLRRPCDVREALGLSPAARLTVAHWLRYAADNVLPALLDDEENGHSVGPHAVTDSKGREIVLVKSISGHSFSEVTISWHGAHHTWEEFLGGMSAAWFRDGDDLLAQPVSEQRELIQEVRKR